jgi:predicted RNase H-like HicB family nuclease
LEDLNKNLQEVIRMLLEDGEPQLQTEFVGTQNIVVA